MVHDAFNDIREHVIKEPEEGRDAERDDDHDRRQSDRFLARRPIDVPNFLPRFRKKIFYSCKHGSENFSNKL
jgi:hypothetical protein